MSKKKKKKKNKNNEHFYSLIYDEYSILPLTDDFDEHSSVSNENISQLNLDLDIINSNKHLCRNTNSTTCTISLLDNVEDKLNILANNNHLNSSIDIISCNKYLLNNNFSLEEFKHSIDEDKTPKDIIYANDHLIKDNPNKDLIMDKINNEFNFINKSSPNNKLLVKKSSPNDTNENKGSRWLVELLYNKYTIRRQQNSLYFYNNYYYELIPDKDIEGFIRRVSPKKYRNKINTPIVNETIKWLKSDNEIAIGVEDTKSCINFINGIYDLNRNKLLPHTKEIFLTYMINANYDECSNLAMDAPNFNKYLNNVSNDDNSLIYQIQELIGVTISEYRNFKKAFFLIGQANSGKSTFLELLSYIVGDSFCSNISFDNLNKTFNLAGLAEKKLNTFGEISEININRFDIFKSLTGNDPVEAEFKGTNPFTFRNKAVLAFAGNNMPKININDSTNAFFNRIIILYFSKSTPKDQIDYNLLNKMKKEVDAIVSFGIAGLRRLIENNFSFTESIHSKRLKSSYMIEHNSFNIFIDENCILEPNCKISTDDLRESYHEFCILNSITPLNDKQWKNILKEIPSVQSKRIRLGTNIKYGFVGIKLK